MPSPSYKLGEYKMSVIFEDDIALEKGLAGSKPLIDRKKGGQSA